MKELMKSLIAIAWITFCSWLNPAHSAGLDLSLPKAPRVDVDAQVGPRDLSKPVPHELLPLGPERRPVVVKQAPRPIGPANRARK